MSDSVVLERLPRNSRLYQPSSGHYQKQRIYILPSRQGIIFSLLLLTMLLGGVNYNNSMAYLLTFLLGSLLMICILHTYQNLAGLIVTTEPGRPVFAGDTASFPLIFNNISRDVKPAIILGSPGRIFFRKNDSGTDTLTADISANRLTRSLYPVKTGHRGIITAGTIEISTTYPLGLFKAWSNLINTEECLVYPKPAGNLPLPQGSDFGKDGVSGVISGMDDFTGFRHYRPGDSIKNIDWKVYSRGQPLQVKKFTGDAGSKLLLSWNHPGMPVDIEDKLSQLCQWVLQAEANNNFYGLELPGVFIKPDRGQYHYQQCLSALACYGIRQD